MEPAVQCNPLTSTKSRLPCKHSAIILDQNERQVQGPPKEKGPARPSGEPVLWQRAQGCFCRWPIDPPVVYFYPP